MVGYAGQVTRENRGLASGQMAEQVWERTHDPTASVASEQSTIGHCNDIRRPNSTPRSSSRTSRICTRSPSHPRVRGEGWNWRIRTGQGLEQTAFARDFASPGLAAFIAASTDDALQERERAEARKHTSNGRTPPWYAPDGLKATSNLAAPDSVFDSVRSAQPSGRLAPTHAAAGALRAVENDAEMADRARACQFYSRGEIPPWLREWSPRGDVTFIRSIAPLDQAYFAKLSSVPNLAAFIATSTSAVLQAREQAEVQKYANEVGCTPPWHRGIDNPLGRGSSSSGSSQGGTSNQDRPEPFQTSPVTANNLPSLETTNPARCDRSVTQIQQTNSFALLEANDDEEDDRNDDAGLFDSDEETARILLQQPGAGATVRTMQPTFPPAPDKSYYNHRNSDLRLW